MILLTFKVIFLFMAVFYMSVNACRTLLKNSVPAINFVYQTLGIVGFVTLVWLI